ncbi:MAG: helix-hairpin-helix domain-containing protein [Nitrospira sp.]|nr:helix-hairpin-helix domain-containing protein [Nitrospira sp.]
MISSLLLKLGLLAVTVGIVFWVIWAPQKTLHHVSEFTAERQVAPFPATGPDNRAEHAPRQPGRSGQEPNSEIVALAKLSSTPVEPLLDLNRAKAGELEALPGIGAVLAQRVIAFRASLGGFRKIEDLREVKGIGAKKFDQLKLLVTVSSSDSKGTTERRVL